MCLTPWKAVLIASHKEIHSPSLTCIYTHTHIYIKSHTNRKICVVSPCGGDLVRASSTSSGSFKVGVILLTIFPRWILTKPGMVTPTPLWACVSMPQITLLTMKQFSFSLSSWNIPCCNLWPLPPALLLHTSKEWDCLVFIVVSRTALQITH